MVTLEGLGTTQVPWRRQQFSVTRFHRALCPGNTIPKKCFELSETFKGGKKTILNQKCEHWKRSHQKGGEVEELVLDHIEELWLVNQTVPGSWKTQVYIIKTFISTIVLIRKPYTVCSSGLRSWKVPNILSQIWETWFIYSRKAQNMHKYHRKESAVVLVQTISVWPMVHLRFRKCKQQNCLWHQGLHYYMIKHLF